MSPITFTLLQVSQRYTPFHLGARHAPRDMLQGMQCLVLATSLVCGKTSSQLLSPALVTFSRLHRSTLPQGCLPDICYSTFKTRILCVPNLLDATPLNYPRLGQIILASCFYFIHLKQNQRNTLLKSRLRVRDRFGEGIVSCLITSATGLSPTPEARK